MTTTNKRPAIKSIYLKDIFADESLQARNQMSEQTIMEYAERMKEGDEFPPLIVFFDGEHYYLSDGYHRYMAALYSEIPKFNCDIREGSLRDAILFACSANAHHGLRRTNADKRKAVERLLYDVEWQKWADTEIARLCSVSQGLVRGLRIDAESSGTRMPDKIQYKRRDGQIVERWATNYEVVPIDLTVKSEDKSEDTSDDNESVINITNGVSSGGHSASSLLSNEELAEEYGERTERGYLISESDEWYTPSWVIDMVIEVLGIIDLDPCSNSHENPAVPAKTHYTIEDNSLVQEWHGTVFMNPPYGGQAGTFYVKLIEEYLAGRVTEAITLSNARTDTYGFHALKDYPICFMRGRVKFINGETGESSGVTTVLPMFTYFGKYPQRFAEVFGRIGNVRVTYSGDQ